MQYVNLGWILVQKQKNKKHLKPNTSGTIGKTEYEVSIRYLGITIHFLKFDERGSLGDECPYCQDTHATRQECHVFTIYFQMIQENTHIYTERKYSKSLNRWN